MNWNISAWCIRNPIPPVVLFLLLTATGIAALFNLSIESVPNIDLPTAWVSVSQSGASPSEIETQITRKVEDAVAGIAGVKHIRSSINPGSSSTYITFELGTNSERATSDVREAINRLRGQLPRGVSEPYVGRQDYVPDESMYYSVRSKTRSSQELDALLETTVKRAFTATASIGQAYHYGSPSRQICVNLDPVRLEAFGVTADMVNSQLKALNVNLPGGRGDLADAVESIRTIGSAHTVEELKKKRIVLPGKKWVELGELGEVKDGVAEKRNVLLVDGKPGVGLVLSRRRGRNIVQMDHDADMVIADLEKNFPDLKFTKEWDIARYVRDSCFATFEAMGLGALLAVLVIFAFLRDWRAALISALAMPLSVIPTFAFMQSVGYTLNDMSLLGLALVIGILVDDAIVEIENIVRHMNLGKKPYQAAIEAADEIGLAVVATTMAAVVVFLPVGFMGGISGLYFRQFGLTVAVAVFCSLLVARLITPLMAAYWLKAHKEKEGKGRLLVIYEAILAVALKYRWVTVLCGLLFFGASVCLFKVLPTSLVSRIDDGTAYLRVELPPGTPVTETEKVMKNISNKLLASPDVQNVFGWAGRGEEDNKGSLNILLKPRAQRPHSQDEFETLMRPKVIKEPGARVTFGGGWGSGRVDLLFTSADSEGLQKFAQELMKEMGGIRELTDLRSDAESVRPEVVIEPDFARAAEQGVSVDAIATTAALATVGDTDASCPKFDLGDRQIPIVVKLAPEFRKKMSIISNLKVQGADGRLVPLSSVAKVRMDSGIFSIERYDRSRQVNIVAKYGADFSLGQALARVKQLPAYKNMPPSISDRPSGDAEEKDDMFGGFGYAIFTGVLLIYSVLVLLFRGFFQPFTIMMSLPLSLGGALIGLWLLKKPIDMYALIGIVMLMGLVTKNAILLVEYCLVAMKERGMPKLDAIFQAGRTRMRPIVMTTTAMIAGMLPIAVGFGAGAEARAPMAISVIGGLFMSTLLTLVVVPVVFSFMDDLEKWLADLFHDPEPPDSSGTEVEGSAEKAYSITGKKPS